MRLSLVAVFALLLLAPGSYSFDTRRLLRLLRSKASTARPTSATASPAAQRRPWTISSLTLTWLLPGTVVSFTGHFTDQTGLHVGPTGGYQIGPINIFGRHLFLVGADKAAAAAIGNKTGGGIEVPLPKGAVLRLGLHKHQKGDSSVDEFTIGVGARF